MTRATNSSAVSVGAAAVVDASSAANGTLLIGNSTGFSLATLTDGSGITITEGAGSIDIAAVDVSASNELQDLWDQITSDSGSTTPDSNTDTLTVSGSGIASTSITGDTLTITATEAQQLFSTIAVATQNNVVADSTTDTLTLAAGSNVNITTDDTTDTVTIAATSSVKATC